MYVLGGKTRTGDIGVDVLKFDSTQGTWSEVAPAPRDIFASAAVAVGTDIYVFGGMNRDGDAEDSVSKYDTVNDTWNTLAPMSHVCSNHSASKCNCLIYIVGAGEFLRLDPASAEWSTLALTPNSKQYCATFVVGGRMYVAGGVVNGFSVERYDVATDTWTAVADMLERRCTFGAVTIGSAGPAEEQDLFDSLIDKASKTRS
jgi:hypothetical protein